MEEELAYLAGGGREGTLLEEVEGLTSGEHDECLFLGGVWMGEERKKGRKRKVGKKRERGKADQANGSTFGFQLGQLGQLDQLAAADLPMLGPVFGLLTEAPRHTEGTEKQHVLNSRNAAMIVVNYRGPQPFHFRWLPTYLVYY